MTFSLYVEAAEWRAHTERVRDAVPGIVPVAKGNGYGFGLQLLADQCARLGVETLAVGTGSEVELVHDGFAGEVLVLTPWHPIIDPPPPLDDRLILTLANIEGIHALAGSPTRVVVELLTSMDRFGLTHDDLVAALPTIRQLNLAGFALHLPLDEGETARVDEVSHAVEQLRRLGVEIPMLWVSHLGDDELATVRRRHPGLVLRPRIGTRLWLGPPRTYQARGTVLAVHPLRRGETFGYRQRKAPRDGYLLIVSGGTSHGVALSAPRPVSGVVPRAKAATLGGLEAAGRVLSPFHVAAKRRWFGEPPHMQVSMVLLPGDVTPPLVGDELDVDMRMTTALFDRVVLQ